MNTKLASHLSTLLPIGLLAILPSLVFGAGLAAIKEQSFHQDAGAKIFVYTTLKDSGPYVKIETASRSFTIERDKLAGKIEVLSALPANITTDAELEPVRMTAKEYRDFSTRFPNSTSILAPHVTTLDACIKEFEGGKARYNGEWIPKEKALAAKQKEEQSSIQVEATIKQKREERQAFEKSQKEKGLAKYNGEWIPIEDSRRLSNRDQDAIESATEKIRQTAAEQAANEAKNAAILATSKKAVLRVISSDGSGALCKVAYFNIVPSSRKDSFGRNVDIQVESKIPAPLSDLNVYVDGITGVADGTAIMTKLIDTGELYTYQTVSGARATVQKLQSVGQMEPYNGILRDSYQSSGPGPRVSSLQSVGGG